MHHNAGFSPFHALLLPIVGQLSQPRVQKGFKRSRDIASASVCKARGLSTAALPHCVFPPPNSKSSPSEPERHRCVSSHATSMLSVNTRCPDGSRPSSPSTWWISVPCSPAASGRELVEVFSQFSQSGHNNGVLVGETSIYQQTSHLTNAYLCFFWVILVLCCQK